MEKKTLKEILNSKEFNDSLNKFVEDITQRVYKCQNIKIVNKKGKVICWYNIKKDEQEIMRLIKNNNKKGLVRKINIVLSNVCIDLKEYINNMDKSKNYEESFKFI